MTSLIHGVQNAKRKSCNVYCSGAGLIHRARNNYGNEKHRAVQVNQYFTALY